MLNWVVTYIGGSITLLALIVALIGLTLKTVVMVYYHFKHRAYWSERRREWQYTTMLTKGQ